MKVHQLGFCIFPELLIKLKWIHFACILLGIQAMKLHHGLHDNLEQPMDYVAASKCVYNYSHTAAVMHTCMDVSA